MKSLRKLFIIIIGILLMGCYPNVKSYEPIIDKSDGAIDRFDEGNYIDNLKRTINIIYSKTTSRYLVSTDDGLFDAFYTKEIIGDYYLLEGIKENRNPVNLYLIKLENNKVIIFQYNIPKNKLKEFQDKFKIKITFDKDQIFVSGKEYNVLELTKHCVKNGYIRTDFFLNKQLTNL